MKKKKILLIEDEAEIRDVVVMYLEKLGLKIETAADGKSGLEKALNMVPDLIVLDLSLPELSGEEVCKTIRESSDKSISEIPILMLTAKASQTDQIIGKVIGASAYIVKPFESNELIAEVKKLINK